MQKRKTINSVNERIYKYLSLSFASLLVLILVSFIIVIFASTFSAWKEFGFKVLSFNYEKNNGLVLPLIVSLFISVFALVFAAFVSKRVAYFIFFRNKKQSRYKKVKYFLSFLAGFPSVVYGLFGLIVLSKINRFIFKSDTGLNLINAIFMLTLMIMPTVILNICNALEKVNINLKKSSLAIGLNESQVIYKIINKTIKKEVITAYFLGFTRAIGESIALAFILNSHSYFKEFSNGFLAFINSSLQPIPTLISANFFGENSTEAVKSSMFLAGILLLLIVIGINIVINLLINKKQVKKNKTFWQEELINSLFGKVKEYKKLNNFYHYWKILFEILCTIFFGVFAVWIVGDVVFKGIKSFALSNQSFFTFEADSTFRALINTLYISFWSLLLILPLAFFAVIYINEYCQNKRMKNIFWSFVNSYTSIPSIIFGIFGFTIFLSTFGWALGGKTSNSMLAGVLTISLFILPSTMKSIEAMLNNLDPNLRKTAASLGLPKWKIVLKVILPKVWPMLLNILILNIAKIASESSPFILTSGTVSANNFSLFLFGQTLTTRMFYQLSNPASNAMSIMYECAFTALVLMAILFYLSNFLVPKLKTRGGKNE